MYEAPSGSADKPDWIADASQPAIQLSLGWLVDWHQFEPVELSNTT